MCVLHLLTPTRNCAYSAADSHWCVLGTPPGCGCLASLPDYVASTGAVPGLLSDQLPSVRSHVSRLRLGSRCGRFWFLWTLGRMAFVGPSRTGVHAVGFRGCPLPPKLRGFPGTRKCAYSPLRPKSRGCSKTVCSHLCVPYLAPNQKPKFAWDSHLCVLPRVSRGNTGDSHLCVLAVGRLFRGAHRPGSAARQKREFLFCPYAGWVGGQCA